MKIEKRCFENYIQLKKDIMKVILNIKKKLLNR